MIGLPPSQTEMQITIQFSTCKWHKFLRRCYGSNSTFKLFMNIFTYYFLGIYIYIYNEANRIVQCEKAK